MKIKNSLLVLALSTSMIANTFGQKIPLVYDAENTGAHYQKPAFPLPNGGK